MPKKETPAKHFTPNYKLKRTGYVLATKTWKWEWVAQPLRSSRKDLAAQSNVPA